MKKFKPPYLSLVKDNWGWFLSGIFILISLLTLFFYKSGLYIQPHDNLDSNVATLKLLKDNNLFFSQNATVPFLNGINRNYLSSELKLYSLLYMLFPAYTAYIIGLFLRLAISIYSFVLLGKEIYSFQYQKYKIPIILCGLLYGIMPTFPTAAISFGTVPLIVYILYKLYNSKKNIYLIALFFYPILSDFATFGIFYCGFFLLFILVDAFIYKRFKCKLLIGLILLSMGYIITEYRLFSVMLFSAEETIRKSYQINYFPFKYCLKESWSVFSGGQYHSGTLQKSFIFPVCFMFFLYINYYYVREKKFYNIITEPFNILFFFQAVNSVFLGFYSYKPLNTFISAVIPPLAGFNFGRTLWLNPFLIVVSFFLVIKFLFDRRHIRLSQLLLLLSFLVIFTKPAVYNDISLNLKNSLRQVYGRSSEDLTYQEFYSTQLFNTIKKEINYNGEKSVAFCFHPSILTYNNIYTIDGYLSFMPQAHKEQFRKLIAPVLELSDNYRQYFDSWGGRAYIFPLNCSYEAIRNLPNNKAKITFDPQIFKEMGGKYVFSRVEISNASEMNLILSGEYRDLASPYCIYLYSIK